MTFIAWVAILSIAGCSGSHVRFQDVVFPLRMQVSRTVLFSQKSSCACQHYGTPHIPTAGSVELCSRLPQAVPSLPDPLPALLPFFGALCCMSGRSSFPFQPDAETCRHRLHMLEKALKSDGSVSFKYSRICALIDGYECEDSDINWLQRIDIPTTPHISAPSAETCMCKCCKNLRANVDGTANQETSQTLRSASQTAESSQTRESWDLVVKHVAVIESKRMKAIELRDAQRLDKEQGVKRKQEEVFEEIL